MGINSKISRAKQERVIKYKKNCDSNSFFNLLTSDDLLSTIEGLLPEHRERIYTPTETLSMFLAQALNDDRSCQKAVNEAAINRIAMGLSPISTRTGAYCRARKRLPTEMVCTLVRETASMVDEKIPNQWRWKGRRVKLIDGTTVSMADTSENQLRYPQPDTQKPGLGFPMCRVLGVMCLASGTLLNADICPYLGKGSDERTMLRNMLNSFDEGDLLLGDANFSGYFFLASIISKGIDAVFEQNGARRRKTDFRKGLRIGPRDHQINLPKPKIKPEWMSKAAYDRAPEIVTIRELKVGKKILITTILSPNAASKSDLKVLYKDRWHVELDLRNIKTTLGMEMLSCKSPDMIEKEIWIYLLAYNLIRILISQAALMADILPREISFKHTVQLWLAWSQVNVIDENADAAEIGLFILIAQKNVGNREGRIEPRCLKRRTKCYPYLTRPRSESRAHIMKFGHPKK